MRGYIAALSNYASFQGRAVRSEFWQFAIVTWFILLAAYLLAARSRKINLARPAPGAPRGNAMRGKIVDEIQQRGLMRLGALAAASLAMVVAAHAEVKLNVESYIGVQDPVRGGTIWITNAGQEITIESITLNRDECNLKLFQPEGNNVHLEMRMNMYLAFNENQRVDAIDVAKSTVGRTISQKRIELKTGDQAGIIAPSILPEARFMGFIEAGSCGSVLVNMTVHTTEGDLYFEW